MTAITPEALDAAFRGEKDVMGVVYALYELVLPGFARDRNGTAGGGFPACSPATWGMVEDAFGRWASGRRRKADLERQWAWANLNYGFREDAAIADGTVDTSEVVVSDLT